MLNRIVAGMLILVFSLAMSGCGIGDRLAETAVEKAVEKTTGVKVDSKDDQLTIKTEQGELKMGGTQQIPQGFPLPVYPEATLVNSIKGTDANGAEQFLLFFNTSKPIHEVAAFYEKELENQGLTTEKTEVSGNGSNMVMFTVQSDKLEGTVQILTGDTQDQNVIHLISSSKK
jgi:hypothetical protein